MVSSVAGMHGYPGLSVSCATKHAIEGVAQVRNNLQSDSDTHDKGAPPLLKSRAGHILIVSRAAGLHGYPGLSVYCATKHAIEGLICKLIATRIQRRYCCFLRREQAAYLWIR
jgi:NADP-dependent 3-hydroxy acid dehydrogenase YdfG